MEGCNTFHFWHLKLERDFKSDDYLVFTNSEIPYASLTAANLTSLRCVVCGKSQALETVGPGLASSFLHSAM